MAAAATVLDIISRFLGMAGEANDEVSATSQVHLSEASRLSLLLRKTAQVWIRLPPSQRPKHWDSIEEPVLSLSETCTVTI